MTALLKKSYKRRYTFRLAAPSFIYPDDYVPNVRRLAPFVDEIELLFFESGQVPSRRLIQELASLARAHEVGYNVHLPSDVSIGHRSLRLRHRAVKTLLAFFERLAPLSPSTWTLHVSCEAPHASTEARRPWMDAVQASLIDLAAAVGDPARISLETLDYPLEWLEDLIAELGVAVCMDLGHLLLRGQHPGLFFERFGPKISIMHLHAVENGRDHQALTKLKPPADEVVRQLLADFKGIISLEVFSFEALSVSLDWLEACTHIQKN
jgi:sugar phosphate isomerase/epimerase